ncbi:MAG: acetate kinase [Negativicutes bacterium]|nr:acetate kinase [Negativicutes bacterium]
MKVLVINCGSSSLKYQLIDMRDEQVLAKGLVERIGLDGAFLTHYPYNSAKKVFRQDIPDHKCAIGLVIDALTASGHGVISSMDEINAVGHRVVHGAEKFKSSVLVTEEMLATMEECVELAPLHNPPNIMGIRACQGLMPGVPQVGVFDTAFHQTMPAYAFLYGLPYEAYERYGIRKYGFHGTSHRYVAEIAASMIGRPKEDIRIITCHLGNGASVAAVKFGRSIDTSMGFTPLEGLVMGTRCGDIDPAIPAFLMKKTGMDSSAVDSYLNKKSGLLGISGVSSDLRDIEEAAMAGNERAQIAIDIFAYNVRKYIGAYVAAMGGVDAIVFTAGVGENSIVMRAKICSGLEYLGLTIDPVFNNVRGQAQEISSVGSRVRVFVIPTNEELVIARDTRDIVEHL